ncbi:extracellular solute-binding protein [Lagierella sp.]|uniref:sugar ABC transporter substrate-binding protein n=1 Tax=Lagierella sp. TaxID=2849657 RepID=UPI0026378622|nr:extracellular solute-binding protein [Lagierella sp.]
MKRKFTKLLALILGASIFLTACGKKAGSNGQDATGEVESEGIKGEITVQVEKDWKEYYQKAADKVLEKNPDSKIEFKEIGSFDHLDILKSTDATNPDFADVFALPLDRFTDLVSQDVLGALNAPTMAKEIGGYDNFDENLGGFFKDGEDYLGFPYNIETLVTYVNTENAKVEGIDYENPIEINDIKDPANVLLPFFDAWFGVAATNSAKVELLKQDGDKFESDMVKDFDKLDPDQQKMFEALYEYWKKHDEANSPIFSGEDEGWAYIGDEFTTGGKGVIRLGGPWEINDNVEKAGEQLEIYPINHITINQKPLTHWQGGWAMAINARIEEDADKKALAENFIMELVRPENASELFKATGKILPNVTADEYDKTDLSDLDKKVIKNVIESYDISEPRPIFKEYGDVWDTWKNAILSWNNVKPASVEDAYKELQASFKSMMENINK